jgi:hypothetical protein
LVAVDNSALKQKDLGLSLMMGDPKAIQQVPAGQAKESNLPKMAGMMPPGSNPGEMMAKMKGNSGPPAPSISKDELEKRMAEKGATLPTNNQIAGEYISIPEKYADPEQSGLTFKISGKQQEVNIPLTSK